MSKLYKVYSKHYAPRDSHEAVMGFVVADDDADVYAKLYAAGVYYEVYDDEAMEREVWDEEAVEYTSVGVMTEVEWRIYNRGTYGDEVTDAHYGVTLYRWEEVETEYKLSDVVAMLRELGMMLGEPNDDE